METLSEVSVLFVGGPHDGKRMTVPGDEHGRPAMTQLRVPLDPPKGLAAILAAGIEEPSATPRPIAAVYEPDLAVSDKDRLWRYRYKGQS